MRLPSTWMICRCGSTRAPYLRSGSPSTSTRPSPISSSQRLLLPTPAAASTFCSRTPPGTSVSVSRSSSPPSWLPFPSGALGLITGILGVFDMIWQEGGEFRQVLQAGQAQALQEVPGGPVEDSPRLVVGARLLDQATQPERPHHSVAVDAAHRGHPRTAHRLPVRRRPRRRPR